ncbi:MAG: hypothetical protein R3C17_12275 [Planctomycetaceae bacterium]
MQLTTPSTENRKSDSGPSPQTISIFRINFDEIYRRHLCRHSQFGLNVQHLIAVYGIYYSVYSLVAILIRHLVPQLDIAAQAVTLAVLSIPYIGVLAANIPVTLISVTIASIALLIAGSVQHTTIPFWVHIVLIVMWHRVQLWGHKRYTLHRDMAEFESRYRKGGHLFLLLAIYELPILLHYFLAGRCDWIR